MAITEVKAASLSRWMRDGQALPLGESDRLARVAAMYRCGASPPRRASTAPTT
ncbi:putative toxin-antitoxin system antitoxin component [Bordetella pertussis]|nr:putative toxin-antitoxin system antitoxin component [Bordetella pertussis]